MSPSLLASAALLALSPEAEASTPEVDEILVAARRRSERRQEAPMAISVVDAATVTGTGAFNIPRLTQLIPSLQVYSQNPRNTSVNIRGIGAPLGLTNDGIEQGVGLYIDQVYYSRAAATSLDFVDVQQIGHLYQPRVLTLFG